MARRVRGVTHTVGKIVVREAAEPDAAAIAQVHIASREATMPYLPPRRRSDEEVVAWVRNVVLAESTVWVAEDGDTGRIVGYAALEGDMLDSLYLLADARRQGIGSRLLAEVRAAVPGELRLHVFQRNTDARAFYTHHGFTVLDMSDGSRNMENEPDMTMRWAPVTNSTRTDR